jgi:hypothetical protein
MNLLRLSTRKVLMLRLKPMLPLSRRLRQLNAQMQPKKRRRNVTLSLLKPFQLWKELLRLSIA